MKDDFEKDLDALLETIEEDIEVDDEFIPRSVDTLHSMPNIHGGNWVVDGRPFSQIIGDANPNAPTHNDHPGLFRDGKQTSQGIQVREELEGAFKGHDLLRMVFGQWVAEDIIVSAEDLTIIIPSMTVIATYRPHTLGDETIETDVAFVTEKETYRHISWEAIISTRGLDHVIECSDE